MCSPTLFQIAIYNAFRVNAENGKVAGSADYRYWKEQGMLERTHQHAIPWHKELLGTILYRLLKMVIPA